LFYKEKSRISLELDTKV